MSLKNSRTWEKKTKKKTINKCFQDKCFGGCQSANFWSTIKSYLSKTAGNSQNKIILNENDKIISNNGEVAENF